MKVSKQMVVGLFIALLAGASVQAHAYGECYYDLYYQGAIAKSFGAGGLTARDACDSAQRQCLEYSADYLPHGSCVQRGNGGSLNTGNSDLSRIGCTVNLYSMNQLKRAFSQWGTGATTDEARRNACNQAMLQCQNFVSDIQNNSDPDDMEMSSMRCAYSDSWTGSNAGNSGNSGNHTPPPGNGNNNGSGNGHGNLPWWMNLLIHG